MTKLHAMPLFLAGLGVAAASVALAQTFEAPPNPLPPLQDIQPADTPTMLPVNDAAPYPAADYLEHHHPDNRSYKRGMLKRQYRWLPEREMTQAPEAPPQPTGLPQDDNAPRDVQGAPMRPAEATGPDHASAPREGDIQRHRRPDLRDRERPGGLGRFIQPPDPTQLN